MIKLRPGVNFTIILQTAFTRPDPKSTRKTVKSSSFFALLGPAGIKAVRKHVDEIDPRKQILWKILSLVKDVSHKLLNSVIFQIDFDLNVLL